MPAVPDTLAALDLPPVYRGATFDVTVWYEQGDPDRGVPLAPVDLTGWAGVADLVVGGAVALPVSTANGRLTLGADGSIRLHATAADTLSLPPGPGRYVMFLTHPDGVTVEAFAAGQVPVRTPGG